MRWALALIVLALLIPGCAARAWPPAIAFGNAYLFDCEGAVTYDANGEPLCDKGLSEMGGGELSEQGAEVAAGVTELKRAIIADVLKSYLP
jgi:hypothetical protein